MKNNILRFMAITIAMLLTSVCQAKQLTVLTYHDIVTEPSGDSFAITRSAFVSQMDYLQDNNYHVISLSELKIYEKYPDQMPDKAVMLTFDDGLKSYAEFVVPLLEIYGFPSIASIVTGWLDGQNVPPEYYKKLINWSVVQQLNKSPLVEFISHSHNLHRGIRANPQGTEEAASITREYRPASQSYESEKQFEQRIHEDLQTSIKRIKEELGLIPSAIAWPYGLYDEIISKTAQNLGLRYQFSLDDGPTLNGKLPKINRIMLLAGQSIRDFSNELTYKSQENIQTRIIELNLDPFIGKSLKEKENILSAYLDQHEFMDANTLIISPFDKNNEMAFFYNRQTNIAIDILGRVINSFRSKLDIRKIYLKLPAKLPVTDPSPTYQDLARLIYFNGIIFDSKIDTERAQKIRQVIDKYKSNIRYGIYGMEQNSFRKDFVIAPINLTEPLLKTRKILSSRQYNRDSTFYLAIQNNNNKKQFIDKANQTFDLLNARHVGYKLNTAFKNPNKQRETTPHEATQSSSMTGG